MPSLSPDETAQTGGRRVTCEIFTAVSDDEVVKRLEVEPVEAKYEYYRNFLGALEIPKVYW